MIRKEVYNSLQALENKVRHYVPGEYLFRKGDFADYVVLIRSGRFSLSLEEDEKLAKAKKKAAGKEEILGLKEVFLNEQYHCSAAAEEESTCYLINKQVLRDYLRVNPMFRFKLMNLFAKEINELTAGFE